MLDREEVLVKAVEDCYREMFAKAQPMADWDNLVAEHKAGKIDEDKDGPVFNRHYLSMEESMYIVDKYLSAYAIKSEWKDYIEILEKYLNEGGTKDKYIEASTDENGDYHPGYRGYEKVDPLRKQVREIIDNYLENKELNQTRQDLTNDITNKVMELISMCKEFYSFNIDELKFRNTLALGATPTSNAETVKQWWKDHYNVDIEIEEHNPLLFWEMDYYGDDFEEVMKEEEGENWKEVYDKKWEEQKAKKKAEYDAWKKSIEDEAENLDNELKENDGE